MSKSQSKREAIMHASPSVEAHAPTMPPMPNIPPGLNTAGGQPGQSGGVKISMTLGTHRYFCDACTGIAFYWNDQMPMPKSGKCKSCGKVISVVKPENFIKL